jgi:hypothetical protein
MTALLAVEATADYLFGVGVVSRYSRRPSVSVVDGRQWHDPRCHTLLETQNRAIPESSVSVAASYSFRLSYAQWSTAWRCRLRHSQSPGSQCFRMAATWRAIARHRRT